MATLLPIREAERIAWSMNMTVQKSVRKVVVAQHV